MFIFAINLKTRSLPLKKPKVKPKQVGTNILLAAIEIQIIFLNI